VIGAAIGAFVRGIFSGLLDWWRERQARKDAADKQSYGAMIQGKIDAENAEKAARDAGKAARDRVDSGAVPPTSW